MKKTILLILPVFSLGYSVKDTADDIMPGQNDRNFSDPEGTTYQRKVI